MPKVVNHEEQRAGFVTASWEVIAEEGLGAATLRRVAAAAGMTTGALTHYFSDREALLVEALRTAHFAAGARMLRAAATAESDRAKLSTVLHEALPLDAVRLREWRVWLAFWGEAVGNPRLRRENEERVAEWRDLLETLVAPLVEGAASSEAASAELLSLIDGLGVRLALAPRATIARERASARSIIEHAIARLGRHSPVCAEANEPRASSFVLRYAK
ncbi:MAG: TetR/AcrR family transcriptional regulator [Brevundimonas sp.]